VERDARQALPGARGIGELREVRRERDDAPRGAGERDRPAAVVGARDFLRERRAGEPLDRRGAEDAKEKENGNRNAAQQES
jgi:hypothetical protein